MTPGEAETIDSVIVYQDLKGGPVPTGRLSTTQEAGPIEGVMIDGKLLRGANITVDTTNRGAGYEVHIQAEGITLRYAEDFPGRLQHDSVGTFTLSRDGILGINAMFKARSVITRPAAAMPSEEEMLAEYMEGPQGDD